MSSYYYIADADQDYNLSWVVDKSRIYIGKGKACFKNRKISRLSDICCVLIDDIKDLRFIIVKATYSVRDDMLHLTIDGSGTHYYVLHTDDRIGVSSPTLLADQTKIFNISEYSKEYLSDFIKLYE